MSWQNESLYKDAWTQSEDLSSVPGTHVVADGEDQLSKVVL